MPTDGRKPMASLIEIMHEPGDTPVLDHIDRQLLGLLTEDSRTSQRQLSRRLHMSPPAISERIARLERAGVIRGYTVDVDWTVLGYSACYLRVTATPNADLATIMRQLVELPEVEDVSIMTGSIDMLARLLVRDHTHLRNILVNSIWQIEGLQRTETLLSIIGLAASAGPLGICSPAGVDDGVTPKRRPAKSHAAKPSGQSLRKSSKNSRASEVEL
jgi:DNA-binding Lrp family transcriptional regulator